MGEVLSHDWHEWFSLWDREWKSYCCELALSSELQVWKFQVVVWRTASKSCTKYGGRPSDAIVFRHKTNHILDLWRRYRRRLAIWETVSTIMGKRTEIWGWLLIVFFQQAFSQYLAYRRDNNELLLFVLKQLAKEQITYFRSRYRSEPDVIEIQEDEFIDRVRLVYFWFYLVLSSIQCSFVSCEAIAANSHHIVAKPILTEFNSVGSGDRFKMGIFSF